MTRNCHLTVRQTRGCGVPGLAGRLWSTQRPYPAEFRARAVALARAGKPITTTAAELGISQSCLHNRIRQNQVNRGELHGITTAESAELRRARRRIRRLELEVETLTKASQFLAEGKPHPQGSTWVSTDSSMPGCPRKVSCRVLGVSSPDYYRYRNKIRVRARHCCHRLPASRPLR